MRNTREKLKKYIVNNLDKFYRLAFSYVKNQTDAEDIVNESVKRALSSVRQLENEEYMGTWIYRIIVNTAVLYIKSRAKICYIDTEAIDILVEEDKYKDIDLYDAIMELNIKYRVIVILRFYEDMTIEQIAYVLNENVSTVKTRLYKALNILKIKLEKEDLKNESKCF